MLRLRASPFGIAEAAHALFAWAYHLDRVPARDQRAHHGVTGGWAERRMKRGFHGAGYSMHVEPLRVRFVRNGPGRRSLDVDISEVRKLLRTDMPFRAIALHLGVDEQALKRFIKRRNLCDLQARHRFIELQRSVGQEAIP